MKTIQIVMDEKLLRAADRAAKNAKVNRSALFREAMREYLKQIRIRELERSDRVGYERIPESNGDSLLWEKEAVWSGE